MCCCSIAQTTAGRVPKIFKSLLVFMLMGIGVLISLYSCAPTTTVIQPPEKGLFRSEGYIVYKLGHRETPEALAGRFLGDERRSWVIEEANHGMTFKSGEFIVIPLKDRNKG